MQKTKINPGYSSWDEIIFGVSQGSILRPLLFKIFLCNLFLIMENIDIASYADDTTLYTTGNSTEEVIQKLEEAAKRSFSGLVKTKWKLTLIIVTFYVVQTENLVWLLKTKK